MHDNAEAADSAVSASLALRIRRKGLPVLVAQNLHALANIAQIMVAVPHSSIPDIGTIAAGAGNVVLFSTSLFTTDNSRRLPAASNQTGKLTLLHFKNY
jgi:hypothetical protein